MNSTGRLTTRVVTVLLLASMATLIVFSCSRRRQDFQVFYDVYDHIEITSNAKEVAVLINEKAISVLGETPADSFIRVGYLGDEVVLNLYVLKKSMEYEIYTVKTEMDSEFATIWETGESKYEKSLNTYFSHAVAELGEDGIIYIHR